MNYSEEELKAMSVTSELKSIKQRLPLVRFTLDKSQGNEYIPKAPLHGTASAAGFDLFAASSVMIRPHSSVLVSTGVRMAIPDGWCGQINPRSSIASRTMIRIGGRIIDSDYRGDVMINLINDTDHTIVFDQHERIAQIVFLQHLTEMMLVDTLEDTARGDGGFGSTGK